MENVFGNTNKYVLTNITHSSSHLFLKLWKPISKESQAGLYRSEIHITVLPSFLAHLNLMDSWIHGFEHTLPPSLPSFPPFRHSSKFVEP